MRNTIIWSTLRKMRDWYCIQGQPKVFCIGEAKTGTTSLEKTFKLLGYLVGDQRAAEMLLRHYIRRDFKPIIKYCRTAQVFQDNPFGLSETYKHLDRAFPNSKFILSVRDSPDQWYNFLVNSHAKKFGKGSVPTADQLKNANYVWKGWVWESLQEQFGVDERDPYNKEKLVRAYVKHNEDVIEYFRGRDNLLVINLADPESFQKFLEFIPDGYRRNRRTLDRFPWENKTSDLPIR
jgi:hypothetical protein